MEKMALCPLPAEIDAHLIYHSIFWTQCPSSKIMISVKLDWWNDLYLTLYVFMVQYLIIMVLRVE